MCRDTEDVGVEQRCVYLGQGGGVFGFVPGHRSRTRSSPKLTSPQQSGNCIPAGMLPRSHRRLLTTAECCTHDIATFPDNGAVNSQSCIPDPACVHHKQVLPQRLLEVTTSWESNLSAPSLSTMPEMLPSYIRMIPEGLQFQYGTNNWALGPK